MLNQFHFGITIYHPPALARSLLDLPEHIVRTQLGMGLAKQLVRHFDRTGRKYFTSPDISSSDQFYKYIADQTSTFVTSFFLKDSYNFMGSTYSYENVNISLLLDELISDNAAFRLVHDYVKESSDFQCIPWASEYYNNDQLFFIIAAQRKTLRRLLQVCHGFQVYLSTVLPQSGKSKIFCFDLANKRMPAVTTTIAYDLAPKNVIMFWNHKLKEMTEYLRMIFDRSLEDYKIG
nr:unnamed protein product [Callosobruchus analis]